MLMTGYLRECCTITKVAAPLRFAAITAFCSGLERRNLRVAKSYRGLKVGRTEASGGPQKRSSELPLPCNPWALSRL